MLNEKGNLKKIWCDSIYIFKIIKIEKRFVTAQGWGVSGHGYKKVNVGPLQWNFSVS